MQKLLSILIVATVFISCTKNTQKTSDVNTETAKLISIVGDSADFYFVYTDNQVTEVRTRSNDGATHGNNDTSLDYYMPYAYLSYEGDHYVKATAADTNYSGYKYTEYFLNDSRLPVKIIIHFIRDTEDVVDFFYNPQTNLLDSVHDTNNSGASFTSLYPQYEGEDITQITLSYQTYRGDTIHVESEFTYNNTQPNVFKTITPLWYIYKTPLGTYNAEDVWSSFHSEWLAKIFSQHTIDKVHVDNWAGDDYWKLKSYTLTGKGQLEKEWYDTVNWGLYYNYAE